VTPIRQPTSTSQTYQHPSTAISSSTDNLSSTHQNQNASVVPVYTGGFIYQTHQTLTHTAINHIGAAALLHGFLQQSLQGHGLPIVPGDPNYNFHNVYDATWVLPVLGLHQVRTTQKNTGYCHFCGFKLVNPQRPDEMILYHVITQPQSGSINYPNYCHTSCGRSHFVKYDTMRFQAIQCLYSPHLLRWGCSANNGHHGEGNAWTYARNYRFIYVVEAIRTIQP